MEWGPGLQGTEHACSSAPAGDWASDHRHIMPRLLQPMRIILRCNPHTIQHRRKIIIENSYHGILLYLFFDGKGTIIFLNKQIICILFFCFTVLYYFLPIIFHKERQRNKTYKHYHLYMDRRAFQGCGSHQLVEQVDQQTLFSSVRQIEWVRLTQ